MRNKNQPGVDLFLKTIISLFFIVEFALAIDTGKLAGRVLDKETGDPLAGANVMILETYMGSAADVDGGYLILNIPPGKYKVRAEVIGYSAMNVVDVLITGDLTTTIDFPLASTVLESDEVVVLAERPLVQADQTSSRRTITSDELLNMPVTSIESAVAYTAGAVNSGGLHFRGGRTSEVIYILDGIPIKDPWTGNSNDTNVPLLSISEANVITSGFGAEYGDAQSGIIELTSKEGRNTFSGNVRINSSNPLSGEPTFESPYESNTVEFALSGPILKDKFHFSIIGEQQNKSGRFRNQRNEMLSYTGRLSYKINDKLKLSFSGLYTKTDLDDGFTYSYSHMISEDLHTGFMPSYVKGFDDLISPISDGIIQDGEVPSFYTDWWTTAGLQTEDADGDGILDLYIEYEPFADWNENGQYDEGEWYNDINGNGVYDNSPYEQDRDATGQLIDPDGDGANEDYNNNFVLDTEGALDSWYGNGILDTEDTNGNGVLDAGEDLNGNGIIDAEDVDQDGKITEFNMFERRPLWQDESHM
ncbi:MAG TPA: TonB-dependent receptor [Candidatus Marinimicrobia bacterium]|nr:TonB-dependent receptor [Candidatus Neomarinimicrobiota bacterium]